jgi:hypothetical protein
VTTAIAALALALTSSTSTSAPSISLAPSLTATAAEAHRPNPLRYAKWAALVDGGWSIALTIGWAAAARSLDFPQPQGLLGIALARVLYGTTYSILLTGEIAIARLLSGEDWAGLSRGAFLDNWLVGFDVPGRCHAGRAKSACGLGLGSFGEVSATVVRGTIPIRVALAGGWIQGRFDDDGDRTLVESTWVQAPMSVRAELPISIGPVKLSLNLGPGIYWGMHNAHVHPYASSSVDLGAPFYELIVLHAGAGPGVYGAAALSFGDVLAIVADADLAAFVLGVTNEGAPAVVAPLDPFRDRGLIVWRRASAGLAFALDPLRISVRYYAVELSPGPIAKLGHRAFGIGFEVPIELGAD